MKAKCGRHARAAQAHCAACGEPLCLYCARPTLGAALVCRYGCGYSARLEEAKVVGAVFIKVCAEMRLVPQDVLEQLSAEEETDKQESL